MGRLIFIRTGDNERDEKVLRSHIKHYENMAKFSAISVIVMGIIAFIICLWKLGI